MEAEDVAIDEAERGHSAKGCRKLALHLGDPIQIGRTRQLSELVSWDPRRMRNLVKEPGTHFCRYQLEALTKPSLRAAPERGVEGRTLDIVPSDLTALPTSNSTPFFRSRRQIP
jgi:hypothetical protein